MAFIAAMRNGVTNMLLVQVISKGLTGVAFVRHQTFGSQMSSNGTGLHELLGLGNVTLLAGREQKSD